MNLPAEIRRRSMMNCRRDLRPDLNPAQGLDIGPRFPRTHLLMTFPVYNEALRLQQTLRTVSATLQRAGIDFDMAVAEDGSTDGTREVILELLREFPSLIVQSLPDRCGRGFALRRLWGSVEADIYMFSDVDLAAGEEALLRVIHLAESGHMIVTGSRYVGGASVNRPPTRHLVSRFYNLLARMWFSEDIQDHQCGLKAFRAEAIKDLLPLCREDSWAWDTEVLVLASRTGYLVTEVPVSWTEHRVRRTPWLRLLSDIWLHGTALMRLKGDLPSRLRVRHGNNRSHPSDETIPDASNHT